MYVPAAFKESRPEVLRALIRRHPLATLVTLRPDGLQADHVPLVLDDTGAVLRGHVARANPAWRDVASGSPVLAVFQGPDHYISPGWYPAKAAHGKVVPTWNYVAVHVRGAISWHEDPAWLRAFLDALTDSQEAARAQPWRVADAPPEYVSRMLAAIVGLEIAVSALEGSCKLSQNRSAEDRAGVAAGLAAEGTAEAQRMSEIFDRSFGPQT